MIFGIALLFWQCNNEQSSETKTTPNSTETAVEVSQKVTSFETLTAQPEDQARALSITGRTQSIEKLQIIAEVQGKALPTKKLLNEGISYGKGETLVKVDDTQYRLNLQAQKSQFQSALVRIMSRIKLDYPKAHAAWDQYLRDFNTEELLKELPEVKDDQLRYFLSANNIFASFYNIKGAEELLPKYQIKAPFRGTIIQGQVSPGSVISPGVPLATLNRTDVYELKASISSADINRLKPGQKIKLTHNNTAETWNGIVNRFGATIDPGTQAIPVFIRVSGEGLREGMFLEATLEADSYNQVVALPLAAMNRNNQVHLIQDSTVKLQDVEPVHYEKNIVWVTGLKGGEQVIVEEIIQPIVGIKAIPKS